MCFVRYIDLGKEEMIEKVILKWEAACAKKYELQVSNDAQEWKTVYVNKDGRGGTCLLYTSRCV